MSSAPGSATQTMAAPRPQAGPAPAASSSFSPIDPIKLLKKYIWVLVGSAIVGGIIGVFAHFALLRFAPTYTAEVIFEAVPGEPDIESINPTQTRKDELDRFMATQATRMVGSDILDAVAQSPRLASEAQNWASKFMSGGAVNHAAAAEELESIVSARAISGTSYISLKVKASKPVDAAGLARLVREIYTTQLRQATTVAAAGQQDLIQRQITSTDQQITELNDRRARMLKEQSVDSLDEAASALGQKQKLAIERLAETNQLITMTISQLNNMEQMRNAETGITYSDTQRAAAEQDPIVAGFRQQIKTLEADLQALREMGIKPGHRDYRTLVAQIDSRRQKVTDIVEEVLARNFDAEYDIAKRELQSLQAQQQQFTTESETYRVQLADLNRTLTELSDIERRIAGLIQARQESENALNSIQLKAQLPTAPRVTVFQRERTPSQPSFPRLIMMIPAGVFLLSGSIGGVILLRELLDQRVKGPADVALLPKARVIGLIADGSEDSNSKSKPELIFRDAPESILAEHIRQFRTTVIKQMGRANARSLVIVGGMPGSGASTIVANLGLACATSELRVLIIDGNFRRPAQHRIFGLAEAPGAADVLSGLTTLEQAVQHVEGIGRLHLLSVGTTAQRTYERLGGRAMQELLAAAADKYDLILIDVPPAVVSGDGFAVANIADASILVVRALGETRGMVSRLRSELADCKAQHFGVLVNAVRSAAGGYLRQNIRTSQAYHTPGAKVGSSIDRDAKDKA